MKRPQCSDKQWQLTIGIGFLVLIGLQCGTIPVKHFYMLNYEPNQMKSRRNETPYQVVIRIKEFDIEQAYAKSQIVYRTNPFELQYYYYQQWAVKPTRMITDLVQKHLATVNLVTNVIRRYDEGTLRPDFELSGTIEALEEYDSDQVWFAHIALRMKLIRLHDNTTIYTRRFDQRKQVYQQEAGYVVRVLSQIMDYIMTESLSDMDSVLAKESDAMGSKIKDTVHAFPLQ